MKLLIVCLSLAAVAYSSPQQYTDRYDNVNVQEILSNRRLLIPYVKCTLGKFHCTPDGQELKSHIQEALQNNCAKCTEKQRQNTRLVIGHLINHEPAYWAQLSAKYDPQHRYVQRYEEELKTIA